MRTMPATVIATLNQKAQTAYEHMSVNVSARPVNIRSDEMRKRNQVHKLTERVAICLSCSRINDSS